MIGEAAARLSPTIIAQTPEIAWSKIAGTRNILVHEYFGIDLDVVWDTVTSDLSPLRTSVKKLLADREDG